MKSNRNESEPPCSNSLRINKFESERQNLNRIGTSRSGSIGATGRRTTKSGGYESERPMFRFVPIPGDEPTPLRSRGVFTRGRGSRSVLLTMGATSSRNCRRLHRRTFVAARGGEGGGPCRRVRESPVPGRGAAPSCGRGSALHTPRRTTPSARHPPSAGTTPSTGCGGPRYWRGVATDAWTAAPWTTSTPITSIRTDRATTSRTDRRCVAAVIRGRRRRSTEGSGMRSDEAGRVEILNDRSELDRALASREPRQVVELETLR